MVHTIDDRIQLCKNYIKSINSEIMEERLRPHPDPDALKTLREELAWGHRQLEFYETEKLRLNPSTNKGEQPW